MMKITIRQLKTLIKEAIEEMDSPASPEEFDAIISGEDEMIFESGTVAIVAATIIATLALINVPGIAYMAAKDLWGHLGHAVKRAAAKQSRELASKDLEMAIESLADDEELASMIDTLASMRGKATRSEVSEQSKKITEYVRRHMKTRTGARVDPMAVRKAFTTGGRRRT